MKLARFFNRRRRLLKALLYLVISASLVFAMTKSGQIAKIFPQLRRSGVLSNASPVVMSSDAAAASTNFSDVQHIVGSDPEPKTPEEVISSDEHLDVTGPPHNYTLQLSDVPKVSNTMSCTDVIESSGEDFEFTEHFGKHIVPFKGALKALNLETKDVSNVSAIILHELAKMPFVKTVCETSFGTGASTFQWLAAEDHVKVHSFSLLQADYSRKMADFMYHEFPEAFFLHEGDPVVYVPDFIEDRPTNFTCDILYLDSSVDAKTFETNLVNFRDLMNKEEHLLLIDSVPILNAIDGPWKVWDTFIRNRNVTEDFRCTLQDYDGHSRGYTLAVFTGLRPDSEDIM